MTCFLSPTLTLVSEKEYRNSEDSIRRSRPPSVRGDAKRYDGLETHRHPRTITEGGKLFNHQLLTVDPLTPRVVHPSPNDYFTTFLARSGYFCINYARSVQNVRRLVPII